MKRFGPALIVVIVFIGWNFLDDGVNLLPGFDNAATETAADSDWRSGQQVKGKGEVTRVLADDNTGSRHQRFIVRLASGRTLLVAHNIDLAPRIPALAAGDIVQFHGEYEWNEKGGVIHWTHRDPRNRHPAGWIEHKGTRYQ